MGSLAESKPSRTQPPMVELTSPRLVLRAARDGDEVELYKAFSDPEVMRYWSTPPHEDLLVTRKWVHGMVEADCNGRTDFIICLRSQGRRPGEEDVDGTGAEDDDDDDGAVPIGKAGVWRDHEIGFLLARAHWGRGLGAEALGLVLDHLLLPGPPGAGDQERQEPVIVADADPRNAASLALLGRLGFERYGFRERTFCVAGEWVDSVYLRLGGQAWRERRTREKGGKMGPVPSPGAAGVYGA